MLKHIHKEKEEEMIKVDMWCHFGHAYVTKVDEGNKEGFSHLRLGKEQCASVVLFETNMACCFKLKTSHGRALLRDFNWGGFVFL